MADIDLGAEVEPVGQTSEGAQELDPVKQTAAAQLLREMFAGAVLCCLLGPQSAAEQISQTSGTQVQEQSPAFVARDELAAPVTGLGQEFEALLGEL